MSHRTFKVSIVIDDEIENFYIKHYVDDFQPIFTKFKNLVFQRNPSVNLPSLKIYWIDAENDKILISCEEDFRMYIEQGAGKKVYFNVKTGQQQTSFQNDTEDDVAMEAEESGDRNKSERKSRKILAREEEKQKRAAKRLAEKMRSAEEKVRTEEERRSRHPEKYEKKNAEKLERAKKRCEQIRQIIGSIDPANLNTTSGTGFNLGASTSASAFGNTASASAQASIDPSLAFLHPSPETIRLLSNAIAGCLQPCNLINKILSDIIGMVPQPAGEIEQTQTAEQSSSSSAQSSNDQQQQTEIPKQTAATNTSDMNTPVAAQISSKEIEDLFKETVKEFEKMNEIVNSSKTNSLASSMTGITQVERVFENFTDSAISDATVINFDSVDAREKTPEGEDYFKVATPPKSMSMRSRESSIEVHDVNSIMSDDSRDWTMLDAAGNDQEESFMQPSVLDEIQVAETSITQDKKDSIKSVETQTPPGMSQEQIQASIQMSIDNAGRMNEIVKNSIASAQASLKSVETSVQEVSQKNFLRVEVDEPKKIEQTIKFVVATRVPAPVVVSHPAPIASAPVVETKAPVVPTPTAPITSPSENVETQTSLKVEAPARSIPITVAPQQPNLTLKFPMINQTINSVDAQASSSSTANRNAQRSSSKFGAAVIVYDPNPKINASVHQMINMGFSNEGGWLTQLLINVDGDVAKAINFLTPQPKHKN